MKYTKEERLGIGRRIYDGEITRYQAAEEYGISDQTARDYMRLYRSTNKLPPKHHTRNSIKELCASATPADMEELRQYRIMRQEQMPRKIAF